MSGEEIKKIENIFRTSESHDELFDAFQRAINIKLNDPEVYKILIASPVLSLDEIKMFTGKLIREIPESSFDLLMWTGRIIENKTGNFSHTEEALDYYRRAHQLRPDSAQPPVSILNLYNYEIDYPANRIIVEIVENSVRVVEKKSTVYYALSDHFKKCGDRMKEIRYFALAEKALERRF